MPQTTVLIPTYNCGKYILETINSILQQSYQDYEILIIDDGSTDKTSEIVSSIKDNRIVYLKQSKNLGIVKALNLGIKIANGKYIARIDADDIMLGDRLQKQINFLEQNLDYGMVGGGCQVINEKGVFQRKLEITTENDILNIGLLFRNQFTHSAITMRTQLAKKLKYQQKYIYCEDFDLWTRFAEISKIANLPYYFVSYRWYSDNTCHTKQKELRTALALLFARELDKLKINYSPEELMMQMAVNFGLGYKLFVQKNKLQQLKDWHNKIFESEVLKNRFDAKAITHFRNNVLPQIAGYPVLKKGDHIENNQLENYFSNL
ncbi:glycosyltransferase family 2 protein [Pedobacter sp. SD-b]|uniref:Glycosyltransferase family 2 protein n=1 Tax=Pedobacter segetis TaxID=2793069 RepID=A0ABS1BI00_9SPHI|nr:glycosyltransferase family 2 protein [Pedobacter segetis]MBK0382513.1 glycosyltransferase family 2 protein [Pedobacter segetis]